MTTLSDEEGVISREDLLLLKLRHVSERLSDPPSKIIDQLQNIAQDNITMFNNSEIINILKSWLMNREKVALSPIHFAVFVLEQVCLAEPLSHGLLDCYLHDALGRRIWVDTPEMKSFVLLILSFLNLQNDCSEETVAKAAASIANAISQRTQEASSVGAVVRTAILFSRLSAVREVLPPLLDRCIANAALSDLFSQLMRALASQIAAAAVFDEKAGGFLPSDCAVVDKLLNLQTKLKMSQKETYQVAISLLVSYKPSADTPAVLNMRAAAHVTRVLLGIDMDGKEFNCCKLLLPVLNRAEHTESVNKQAAVALAEACQLHLADTNKLLQHKHFIDWIMRMMKGIENICWVTFHSVLLDTAQPVASHELLHFYCDLAVTTQYYIAAEHLKAITAKAPAAKAPGSSAIRRGGAVARGRGRGGSHSSMFRQGVRDKITEGEVGNSAPPTARGATMTSDQFLFLISSLRSIYTQWLSRAMHQSDVPAIKCIEWLHRVSWVNPSLINKEQEKYVIVYLRDNCIVTAESLTALTEVITTALKWCREENNWLCFYTRVADMEAVSNTKPKSYIDCVLTALDLVEHHVKRSIKSEYYGCNAFLAYDPMIFDQLTSLIQLDVAKRKVPKSWTATLTEGPLPLPRLTSRRLFERLVVLFCVMGAMRRDTFGCYLWNNHPSVRDVFTMIITNQYACYTEEISSVVSKSEFANVSNEAISVRFQNVIVTTDSSGVVVTTDSNAECALRHAERLVGDLLHASLTRRRQRRAKASQRGRRIVKRKRTRKRSRRRKKKRRSQSVAVATPEIEATANASLPPESQPEPSPVIEQKDSAEPTLRRSMRIRNAPARFNIQDLLQSDDSESESEGAASDDESEHSEIDSASEAEEMEEIPVMIEGCSDTLGLSNGHFELVCDVVRDDFMFLGPVSSNSRSIGRELSADTLGMLRNMVSTYGMAELLRQCSDPDFILLAVGEPSPDTIGKTLKWLNVLLDDANILSRIPIRLCACIFRRLCENIVSALYERNIWNEVTDRMRLDDVIRSELLQCIQDTVGGLEWITSLAKTVAVGLADMLCSTEHEASFSDFYDEIGHHSKHRRMSMMMSLSILERMMQSKGNTDQEIFVSVFESDPYSQHSFDLLNKIRRSLSSAEASEKFITSVKNALLYSCNSDLTNGMLKLLKCCGQSLFTYMLTFSRRQLLCTRLISAEGDMIIELIHDLCNAFSADTIGKCIPTDEYTEKTIWKSSAEKKGKTKKGVEVSLDAVRVLCAALATAVKRAGVSYTTAIENMTSKYPILRLYILVQEIVSSSPCGFLAPILLPLTCSAICLEFPCDMLIPLLCQCNIEDAADFAADAVVKIYEYYLSSTSKKITSAFKHWVNETTKEKMLHLAKLRDTVAPAVEYILHHINAILPGTVIAHDVNAIEDTYVADEDRNTILSLIEKCERQAISTEAAISEIFSDITADRILCALSIASECSSSLVWLMLPRLKRVSIEILCEVLTSLPVSLLCIVPTVITSDIFLIRGLINSRQENANALSTVVVWYEIMAKHCRMNTNTAEEFELEGFVELLLRIDRSAIANICATCDENKLPMMFHRPVGAILKCSSDDVYDNIIRLLLLFTCNDVHSAAGIAKQVFRSLVNEHRMHELWMKRLLSGLYIRHPQEILHSISHADVSVIAKDDCCIVLGGIVESIYLANDELLLPPRPLISNIAHTTVLDSHITFALWQLVTPSSSKEHREQFSGYLVAVAEHYPVVFMQYYGDVLQILLAMVGQCELSNSNTQEGKPRSSTQDFTVVSFTKCILECMLRITWMSIEISAKWERVKDALELCLRIAAATKDSNIGQLVRCIREEIKDADNFARESYVAILDKISVNHS